MGFHPRTITLVWLRVCYKIVIEIPITLFFANILFLCVFFNNSAPFYAPWPRPAGGIERSGCPYVRTYVRPVRRSICPSEDQVKIFGQGRISRPINGSKLIFHMRMYLYETSRNIQKPWPHDLYFMVHWLWTLARLSRLGFLSKVESQDLLTVASWYFVWICISMRPAGIYEPWPPDLYFTVCWFSIVNIIVIDRGLSSTDGSKLIFYEALPLRPAASAFMPGVHFWGGWVAGARGQYLGHHRCCHISKTSWWMNIILGILVQCDALTWNYVCRSVTYISWSSDFALFSDFELPISAYIGLLKFDMKMFVNIAR